MSETAEITVDVMGIEFQAEVSYNYTPGIEPYLDGLPKDCHPGEPDEFEINTLKIIRTKKVALNKTINISNDISELIPLIEDELIEEIKEWQAANCE
tara:strand:- start:183 stop:473 length:291 start_codon:yes stop_codon:yes gene_type:complete